MNSEAELNRSIQILARAAHDARHPRRIMHTKLKNLCASSEYAYISTPNL